MKWMRNHPGRRITVDQLGSLFNVAYLKSATLANAVSGFERSGIFPFNPEIIPEHEFIDDPRDIHGNTNETKESNAALVTSSSVILNDTTDFTSVQFHVCQNYSNDTDTSLGTLADNTLIMLEVSQTKKCTNEDEAVSENITALSCKNGLNESSYCAFSFSDIVEIPKLKVPSKAKKGEKSEIITSSPYKRRLLENIKNGSKKKDSKNPKKAK